MLATRRVSCKDLGEGDCQGWLYQRKEQHRFLGHNSRWTKRWVVLKNNYLYCYKEQNEEKAECLIHLPGFTVAPALECKSKKHSFKLFNPSTAFQFASDSQSDMSAWMSKMGLAAISYMTQNDLLPEAFCYSETDDSEEGVSPTNKQTNRYLLSSKPSPIGGFREQSPAALSSSSSDTNNSIKEELYGRSRIASSTSTFYDIRQKHKPSTKVSQNSLQNKSTDRPSPIPNSPIIQQRMGYLRSASSLEANDITAARNRRQLLSESNNTRYAKIVFPQSQNMKGSFSPQIPPRRLRAPFNQTSDSGSLDRQRLNFLKNITSGNVCKITDSYNSRENIETPTEATPRQIQAPRPLPRKSINRRENVVPGFVAKMTDNYDLMNKPSESRIPPIPNTPPTRPAVPKPTDKFNGMSKTGTKSEQNTDDTYEYVFRPTMAMIKTGIVNPLYERVPNNTWSGDCRSNSTGKSRMPLPEEMKQSFQQNLNQESKPMNESQSPNELSILDREYNRLYGTKKPNERLSPKKLTPFVPKSASSAEIENIYTSKPRKTSVSSIGHFDDSPQLTPFGGRDRPNTPSSSDNSMSSSSGISSYYSTYLEIPAEQMHRMKNNRRQTSTSSYHSTKSSSSPSADCPQSKAKSNELPVCEDNENTPKANKSPQKSSSFRLFSSPKLLKKLSTPKYHKERHLEKKDVNNKVTPFEETTKDMTTVTKTSRLFLGSPKLTRALFGSSGSSKKNSPPIQLSQPTPQRRVSQENSHSGHKFEDSIDTKSVAMNRSSSDSSVQSSNTGVQHKSHHIIEKRLKKPELTIELPLVTESSTDSSEMPLTPETPRKPTMGIAMIGKKRRPSNVSTDRSDIETALNQYYGQTSGISSRSPHTTDTDDEWASIVRTIEVAGLTLDSERKGTNEEHNPLTSKQIDDEKLCQLVLSLRAVQRRLNVSFASILINY